MALGPERSKKKEKKELDRREILLGGAALLAAGALPHEASAVRHPIDPKREAAMTEEIEIASRMQSYQKFVQEYSSFIDSTLIMHDVFEAHFAPVFKMLMQEYVMKRLKREPATDGLRILADEGLLLSAWMIEEIKRRWKVGDDSIKEERIQSLIRMLSRLAGESLKKEKPGEQ